MTEPEKPIRTPRRLRDYFRASFREANRARPLSFYLMFAILAVVILGGQVAYVKEDPQRFAFFLSLNFVFFALILFLSIQDAFHIARKHFRERENVFRDTLGDASFVTELGDRVAQRRGEE